MYIEDILKEIIVNTSVNLLPIDQKILASLNLQVSNSVKFTEKQANLCVNLLKKYRNKLSQILKTDISIFLENPQFRESFRIITDNKTIKIVNHQTYIKAIRMDFPYSEELILKFRENRQFLDYATWDKEERCWFFSLDEKSIKFAIKLIEEHNFNYDENFKIFIDQANTIKNSIDSFIPMAIEQEGMVKFINISPYTPQNSSLDFLESILFAKEIGISTWDQNIEEKINQLPYEKVVKNFIKHDIGKPFELNLEDSSLFDLLPILKYLLPCLVVIPDKDELEKLQKIVELFQKLNFMNSDISVLFRLPSESGSAFNNYVKENKFNSPISEKTKSVIINSQIPKTIFNSSIQFNSVLNFNFFTVHYKLKNYLHNHKNVINILDKTPQRSFNFAFMQSNN